MNDIPERSEENTSNKTPISSFEKITGEILAILVWVYVWIKLFIFDFDLFLINEFFPNQIWILNYKFFILMGIIALIFLLVKTKTILRLSLFLLFYPLIILFWRIPYFIFKQKSWVLAFGFVNAIISFFVSLKYNFIISTLFLISFALTFSISNKTTLWTTSTIILLLLFIVYVERFILVFKPSDIFRLHIKFFSGIRKHASASFELDEDIKQSSMEKLGDDQLRKWTNNLQFSVLFNRVCLFAAKKLKDYQNSRLNSVFYVFTIFLLVVLTIFSFGAINYALYIIENQNFSYSQPPTTFTFFYYSFNNLIFKSIPELIPITPISQAVSMLESFFVFFLVVVFVSLLLSVGSQRHSEELTEVINNIEKEGHSMEGFIKDEYKINTIDEAITELEKVEAVFLKFINKITENLNTKLYP